jgi:hypothetical protein
MRGVVGHGVLLTVALIVAWFTWTRDDSVSQEEFEAVVWTGEPEAVDSVSYTGGGRSLVIARRGDGGDRYLWGWQAEPVLDSIGMPTPEQGERSGFPTGREAENVFRFVAPLRALRDLGALESLTPERREEYGLSAIEDTLVVHVADGEDKRLLLGGTVFGGSGRYALVPATGRAYAISGVLSQLLESGRTSLRTWELHTFDFDDVGQVVLTTPRSERVRLRTGGTGGASTWAAPDSPDRVDATFGNFMSRVIGLSPVDFVDALPADSLDLLATLEYQDDDGGRLGVMEFFRGGEDGDGHSSYYVRTEETRILARPSIAQAERVASDLDQLFGGEGGPQAAAEVVPP